MSRMIWVGDESEVVRSTNCCAVVSRGEADLGELRSNHRNSSMAVNMVVDGPVLGGDCSLHPSVGLPGPHILQQTGLIKFK